MNNACKFCSTEKTNRATISRWVLDKAIWQDTFAENRSIPRNRLLAKIFYDISLIEGWGTGFQRMVDGCANNGNPKPDFRETTGAFVVTFIRRTSIE
jgi:predicted HTH transcriptional regulator